MGCPCSDDSQSESSEEDDDGFDSEGSSELSEDDEDDDDDDEDDDDDDDDDDEGGDSEDSEAERLWASLSRSQDPYDLRNFTARLHTNTPPRRVPARPPSSTQSSPASSPELPPVLGSSPELPPVLRSSPELPPVLRSSPELPPVLGSSPELPPVLGSSPLTSSPLSSSPPSGLDSWDDSGSEAEEAQSFLNSFSSFSDPYSLFNFQAPIRTRGPQTAPQTPPDPPHHNPTAPSRYRKKESGFSEPTSSSSSTGSSSSSGSSGSSGSSSQSCGSEKKVRFCDDVEEFFTSGGDEDRRGPWEELARDRCRFLRRCQEVELSIGPVLQPLHRRSVYARIARSHDLRDDTMNTD